MKTAPPALIAFIHAHNTFHCVDLYEFALADGVTFLRYTTTDFSITYPLTGTVITPGATFLPTVGIERDGVQTTSDLSVQGLSVKLLVNDGILYGTPPKTLAQAAVEGLFDAARVKLFRGFIDDTSGVLVDALLHFEGTVGKVDPTSSEIDIEVKSELDKLNIKLPRNLLQPSCAHVFLDQGCDPNPPGTLRAASTSTGALTGAQTQYVVRVAGTHAADFFKLGAIRMTSGVNAGAWRAIRSSVNGGGGHELTLSVPLRRAPAAADTYSIIVGCDRTLATCTAKGNQARFRGWPYVPRPEDTR